MENKNMTRFCGMLGFAMRAGRVIIGADQVAAALPNRTAKAVKLVLVSYEASEATKKRFAYKCEFYRKELRQIDIETSELGRLLGKQYAPAVIAITDDKFAEEITLALDAYESRKPSVDQNEKRKESSAMEDR